MNILILMLMALMMKTDVGWGQVCGVRDASLNLEREINGSGTKNVNVRWHLVKNASCTNGLDIEFTNQIITNVEQIFAIHGIILNRVACEDYQYGIIPVCSDLLFNTNQICDFTGFCNNFALNVFLIQGDGEGLSVTPGNLCFAKINSLSHKNVIAHEIGHCFGLFHTSHGRPYWISLPGSNNFWSCTNQGGITGTSFLNATCNGSNYFTFIPFEKVNGSNNATSGDFVRDTPADIALGSFNCSPATNCSTSSSCADALDDVRRRDPNCDVYNVPWNNIMRFENMSCQNTFTPGQVTRMKGVISNLVNYVESEPCMVCNSGSEDFCSPCHPAHEHITNYNITGNVTYDNPRLATQTINIKSGGKLIITNFVYFKPGVGINVESGGTLELTGGHLTACSINWGGVSMGRGGDVNIINGGTISKAIFGVYNFSGNTGGILTCNNAHFYDNIYGVLLSRCNAGATFQNATFTGMAHGVYLDNVPGKTRFSDCTFAYQTGNGITSFGSGIDVSSNNTFTGSDNGIAAYNLFGANTQSKIGDALLANTISNCNKGVYAVNAELLIRNNYLQGNSFSLYYSGQNIFQSTANTFSGASYAEGIYSTGEAANQSHNNQYNSDVGIFPYLYNGGYTFYNNCFRTQWWDVNAPTGAQINVAQEGPGGAAASNCFTKGGVPDFICETSQTVIYKIPSDSLASRCLIPQTPGNYILDPVNSFSNSNNCVAGRTGVSEYDYLKNIGCDSLKLHRKIDSLNSIVKILKNKTIPLTTAEKATLAKTERHLRYAINQWAWCLRKRAKRSQLKEWYTAWSIEFPDDTYFKIKGAEVSVESGQYSLAKLEIDTLKTLHPSMSDIWDALNITVDVHDALDAVSLQPSISEPENTPYQEIARIYILSQSNRNLLRRVAAMSAPEAAYGRALLAYLTGEQIEPQINYTLVPRTTTEKTEQVREEVQILPNPAQDYLSISIKNRSNESQYSYELYTITGQNVMQGQLKDQNELNISLLAQGLYFMSINKDGLRFNSQKIIIQK